MATGGILILLMMMALAVAVPILIGVTVHKDAKARGMEPWLWALVSALVPYFIGLIVYLVVASGRKTCQCGACGTVVEARFSICPQCGGMLKHKCGSCGNPVETEWRVCPQCGAALTQERPPLTVNAAPKINKAIWIILGVTVGLVLLAALALIGFNVAHDVSSTVVHSAPMLP